MLRNRKFVGIGTILVLLFVLLASQLHAQTPTVTPTTTTAVATATTTSTTPTPSTLTALVTRQAVVKRPVDGDTVEVVFTDTGDIAMVHLANVDAPESLKDVECFGRESSEFAAQAYGENPLVSIGLVGDVENDEAFGYVRLANGILLNELVVLFGYARFDDRIQSKFTLQIKNAEEQSKQGKTGLWKACGESAKPLKPCYLFNSREIDSASKRALFAEYSDVTEVYADFMHAYFDQVQHEVIVTWDIRLDGEWGWRMDEYYRLSDCMRDRSEVYVKNP